MEQERKRDLLFKSFALFRAALGGRNEKWKSRFALGALIPIGLLVGSTLFGGTNHFRTSHLNAAPQLLLAVTVLHTGRCPLSHPSLTQYGLKALSGSIGHSGGPLSQAKSCC